MAASLIRDPNNSRDEERRRRTAAERIAELRRNPVDYLEEDLGRVRQDFEGGGLSSALGRGVRRGLDQLQVVGSGAAEAVNSAFVGPQRAAQMRQATTDRYYAEPDPTVPQTDFSGVGVTADSAPSAQNIRDMANARQNGLTRIVKTADGTYVQTSDPNVKGQERIYDELGNRADRSEGAGFSRPGQSVQEAFAAEQAGQNYLDTAEGREAIVRRGRGSLERIARMGDEAGDRRERQFLDELSPKERVDLLEAQAKEQGLDRRAAAQLAVTREGQQAARMNAQTGAVGTQIKTDQYERERLSDPATRPSAIREFFGSLPLDEESRVNALLNTERGRRIMDVALQGGAAGSGNSGFRVAGATRTNGLLRALGADPFTDDAQFVGGNFDPADFGMTEQDYDLLIKAARQQYVGQ